MNTIITMADYWAEQSNAIARKCLSHTPIIYKILEGRTDRPDPVGSSLLIKYEENYFLITASHIRKWGGLNDLGLFFEGIITKLEGDEFNTQMPTENDDKIDLWIIRLSDAFVKDLPTCYSFFDIKGMNIDVEDNDTNSYLLVGFPTSRFKLRPEKKVISNKPFAFRTNKSKIKDIYNKTNSFEDTNLVLYYRKRRIKNTETNQNEFGPDLQGASGCGVWLITSLINGAQSTFLPVAMAIEHDKDNCAIVSTRINVITEFIRTKWHISIPPSKKVCIKYLTEGTFTFENLPHRVFGYL